MVTSRSAVPAIIDCRRRGQHALSYFVIMTLYLHDEKPMRDCSMCDCQWDLTRQS